MSVHCTYRVLREASGGHQIPQVVVSLHVGDGD